MKNKNGFTLIELLAVIIILGILMIIAIPSVTSYINNSRKSAYVDTAREIISGARNLVNEGKLKMYDTNTTYYIPADYIKTEGSLQSPYGAFTVAYVGVIFDGKGYKYYWVSVDETRQGVDEVTPIDELDEDDIKSDVDAPALEQMVFSTGIGDREVVKVLVNGEWETKTENANTIPEEGGGGSGGTKTAAQQISEVEGLYDIADAKRYVGPSPSNYVKFNGNELWRIVGVYGNKLKIISTSTLDSQPFSTNSNNVRYPDSDIKPLLNGSYYDSLTSTAKEMIDENGVWNIGASSDDAYPNESFTKAKTSTWTGKVGIIAIYEFLYATNDASCYNVRGNTYYNNSCGTSSKNWLVPSYGVWAINPYFYDDTETRGVPLNLSTSGYVTGCCSAVSSLRVQPVVYLKSSVTIESGSGTYSDPYILK